MKRCSELFQKPTPAQDWTELKGRQLDNIKLGSDQISDDLDRSELPILHSVFLDEVGTCNSPIWSFQIPYEEHYLFDAPYTVHLSGLNLSSLRRSQKIKRKVFCELSNAISMSNVHPVIYLVSPAKLHKQSTHRQGPTSAVLSPSCTLDTIGKCFKKSQCLPFPPVN